MNRVWETFAAHLDEAYNKKKYATEQAYMTHAVGLDKVNWWPESWVASFKRVCHRIFPLNRFPPPKTPKGASILCFHGHPNPNEAIEGFAQHKGRKVPIHQTTLPAPWIKDLWELD